MLKFIFKFSASTQNTSIATPMTGATAVSRRSTTGKTLHKLLF